MTPVQTINFRQYAGDSDIPKMLAVHASCREVDRVDRYSVAYRVPNLSPEAYARDIALSLADGTLQNVMLVEVEGEIVAHARIEWWPEWVVELGSERTAYLIRAWVRPEWRNLGIGTRLLKWGEQRAREMDADRAVPGEFAANATDDERDSTRLLLDAGYEIRFLSPELSYDDLSNLAEATTPEGFEVKSLSSSDLIPVARALVEANSPGEWTKEHLAEWVASQSPGFVDFAAHCDPRLSRIAWRDDEVAGLYLCRRKDDVGDVANVAVAHKFRLQGVSRSLMFHCLHAMRDDGIQRARVFTGIGADRTAAPEGPYKMYLSFGFQLLTFHNRYRKPID